MTLTVTLNVPQAARYQAAPLPVGMRIVGTVTRAWADTGALVLCEHTGAYVQINASVLRSLPQREIQALVTAAVFADLGPAGNTGRPWAGASDAECTIIDTGRGVATGLTY